MSEDGSAAAAAHVFDAPRTSSLLRHCEPHPKPKRREISPGLRLDRGNAGVLRGVSSVFFDLTRPAPSRSTEIANAGFRGFTRSRSRRATRSLKRVSSVSTLPRSGSPIIPAAGEASISDVISSTLSCWVNSHQLHRFIGSRPLYSTQYGYQPPLCAVVFALSAAIRQTALLP